MLISYNKYKGLVTRMRVIKSGGVIMAATSIMMRNECFRYFESILFMFRKFATQTNEWLVNVVNIYYEK